MGPERQLDQLVVEFGYLRIRVERAGGYQAGAGSTAAPSTTGSPPQGALAGLHGPQLSRAQLLQQRPLILDLGSLLRLELQLLRLTLRSGRGP